MIVTRSHRTAPFQPTGSCPVALTFGTRPLAEEILALINHGHMPLADERVEIGAAVRAATSNDRGPYGKKDRTYNALIGVKTLNSFARGRGLKLPWHVPPKDD